MGAVPSKQCALSNGQVNARRIVQTLTKEGNIPALTLRVAELQEVVSMSALYALKDDVNWAVARSCLEVILNLIFSGYEEIAAELPSTVQARTSAE